MQRLSHCEDCSSVGQEQAFEVEDRFRFYLVTDGANVSVTE